MTNQIYLPSLYLCCWSWHPLDPHFARCVESEADFVASDAQKGYVYVIADLDSFASAAGKD